MSTAKERKHTAVVLGASGFLGQSLVQMLSQQGVFAVRGVDLRISEDAYRGAAVVYETGDLTDEDRMCEVFKGASVVIHVASPDPQKGTEEIFEKVNVKGAETVVNACKRASVSSLVYTSSASVVYDGSDLLDADENTPVISPEKQPDSYVASKAKGEAVILEANNTAAGFCTVAIRPHSVFGWSAASSPDGCLRGIVEAGARGKLRFRIGNGENLVDFTHVDNAAWAHILSAHALLNLPPPSEIPDPIAARWNRVTGAHSAEVPTIKVLNEVDKKFWAGARERVAGRPFFVTDGEPMRFWSFASLVCGEMGFARPCFSLPTCLMHAVASVSEALLGSRATFTPKRVKYASTHHSFKCDTAKADLLYAPLVTTSAGLQTSCMHLKWDADSMGASAGEKEKQKAEVKVTARGLQGGGKEVVEVVEISLLESWGPFGAGCLQMLCFLGFLSAPYALCVRLTLPAGAADAALFPPFDSLSVWQAVATGIWALLLSSVFGIFAGASTVPVVSPLPVLGAALQFAAGPVTLVRRVAREVRETFALNMCGKKIFFMSGPQALDVVFAATDEELSQKEVYALVTPLFGKGIVYDAELDVRLQQFHFLTGGLAERFMKGYAPIVVQACETYFQHEWKEKGTVDINVTMAELVMLTASKCLLGSVSSTFSVKEAKELAHLYHELEQGITYISAVAPNLPIPKHIQRSKARQRLAEIFGEKIRERRKLHSQQGPSRESVDVLDVLLASRYKDGRAPTDDEMTGLLITLLFAGQHTSSITSAWTIIYLLTEGRGNGQEPLGRLIGEWMSLVGEKEKKAEEDKEAKGQTGASTLGLTYEMITKQMEWGLSCILEALRLTPPLVFVMRYAKVSRKWKGHTFPAGSVLAASPPEAGHNPDVWERPEEYRPQRWIEVDWDTRRKANEFISFGNGRHTCMGRRFAFLQIRTILATMTKNYVIKSRCPRPGIDESQMVVGPKGEFLVEFEKIPEGVDPKKAWEAAGVPVLPPLLRA